MFLTSKYAWKNYFLIKFSFVTRFHCYFFFHSVRSQILDDCTNLCNHLIFANASNEQKSNNENAWQRKIDDKNYKIGTRYNLFSYKENKENILKENLCRKNLEKLLKKENYEHRLQKKFRNCQTPFVNYFTSIQIITSSFYCSFIFYC